MAEDESDARALHSGLEKMRVIDSDAKLFLVSQQPDNMVIDTLSTIEKCSATVSEAREHPKPAQAPV